MPRGGLTSFFIELIDLRPVHLTTATRGDSMIRDLFLDPLAFSGKFTLILFMGRITKGSRAFGLGVEQTSEEIG